MISTGLKKLDNLLGGGIQSGTIIDIYGQYGSGKTHLAIQTAINSLQSGGNVVFLDTTGGFRPERMLEIIQNQGLEPELMDRVEVGRITNTAEQIQYLSKISNFNSTSLIVVDNLTDLFSFEYSKKENSLEKHNLIMRFLHELSLLAIQKKIPIVVINILRRKDNFEIENLEQAISIYTHIKIRLSKSHKGFVGEVYPSFLKKRDFAYSITRNGINEPS